MLRSLNVPLMDEAAAPFGGWDGLAAELERRGLDGVEGIWSGGDIPECFPKTLLTGYHLTFFPDWLDMYTRNEPALKRKFGSVAAAEAFYGGLGPERMLDIYRSDLDRAIALGAKYVVFHVSDVSLEEGYTYRWLHSNEQVIDLSAECVNTLLDGAGAKMDFLLENQWWPGFTFTSPHLTRRMLDAVEYPRKGIMLDTGHLMNTNTALRTEREGAEYILKMLGEHGELCRFIKGVHLHRSLSGEYVRAHTGALPEEWPDDYNERFGVSYGHILSIDRHEPWSEPCAARIVERIAPDYLTHELSGGAQTRLSALDTQLAALRAGKNKHKNGETPDGR